MRFALAAVLAAALASCAAPKRAHVPEVTLASQWRHPARRIESWDPALLRFPFAERIAPANDLLIDYLRRENELEGCADVPEPALPEPALLEDLRGAMAEVPAAIQSAVEGKLLGVYLVRHLGSTGFTENVHDVRGRLVAGLIVLDVDLLGHRANAWATLKEATVFRAEEGYELKVKLEDSPGDTRKNAVEYILMHELGHVLSIGSPLVPSWGVPASPHPDPRHDAFSFDWKLNPKSTGYASRYDGRAFPERPRLIFYAAKPVFAIPDAPRVYEHLARTDFPTLYAATNPYDDFAESLANYVHVVLMKRPYQVEVSRRGRIVAEFGSCWQTARCARKRALIEKLLAKPEPRSI